MDLHLNDKRILVTGSTSGIGKETAKAYLLEGAAVLVHGLEAEEVEACVRELSAFGKVTGKSADLTELTDVQALCEFAMANGAIDVLVNNVGIFSVKPFVDLTDDDWFHYIDVNVLSAVRMSRIILPAMLERDSGSIVNIASEAAVKPLSEMIHYSVTKTAILGLTRGMAELTKGTQVRVNSILPGPTWTEGVRTYFDELAKQSNRNTEEIIENYFRSNEPTSLIQRFTLPEEIARMIVIISTNTATNGAAHRAEGGIIRSIL